MNERRITAAKPARVRRDVAGFGPVATPRRSDSMVPADAPVIRVVLVPADDTEADGAQPADADEGPTDWREW